MSTIIGIKKKFKDCNVGDIFSLTKSYDTDLMYGLNIKVNPSIKLDNYTKTNIDEISVNPFNVIALDDGRVRTFHNESEIWVFNKSELFN